MRTLLKYIIVALIAFPAVSVFAEDWSDLRESQYKLYGSEKEEKLSINAFIVQKEDWKDHHSLMVLGLFKATNYPKYRSVRLFPFFYFQKSKLDIRRRSFLFPFYYESRGKDSRKVFTPLSLYHQEGNQSTRLYGYLFYHSRGLNDSRYAFLPLLYFGKYNGKVGKRGLWFQSKNLADHRYFNILPFFAFSRYTSAQDPVVRGYRFASPLFYISKDRERWIDSVPHSETFSISPFHIYYNHYDQPPAGTYHVSYFWAPVFFPLVSYSINYKNDYAHWNVAAVLDLAYDKKGFKRFWAFPLVFVSRDLQLYDFRFHFYPEHGETHGTSGKMNRFSVGTLFFWYDRITLYQTVNDLPTIKKKKTDKPVKDPEWDIVTVRTFWAWPFLWYSSNRYLHIAPFFFRTTSRDASSGKVFGPLYYYNWEPGRSRFWAGLYWQEKEHGHVTHRHLLPLFYSWKTNKSEGLLLAPVFFNYEDSKRKYHFNLLGFSMIRRTGPLNLRAGLGRHGDGHWYLDSDISWPYGAFQVSSRFTFELGRGKEANVNEAISRKEQNLIKDVDIKDVNEKKTAKKKSEPTPQIKEYSQLSRENSRNYFGWKFLYGLMAYEKGDGKRHFRALPLAWFSWDENSNNRVYFVPGAFFHYAYHKTRYTVVMPGFLPIYGAQQKGDSYIRAYGVFGLINEYDAKEKRKETSILWPFINYYSSLKRAGVRVLPFFWHKRNYLENGRVFSRTISLLSYDERDYKKEDPEHSLFRLTVTPFTLWRGDEVPGLTRKRFWSLPLPIFYYGKENIRELAEERSKVSSYLFPLYFTSRNTRHYKNGVNHRFTLAALPGIVWNRSVTTENPEGKPEEKHSITRESFFALGLAGGRGPDKRWLNLFWRLYHHERELNSKEFKLYMFYGLFGFQKRNIANYDKQPIYKNRSWLLPLYYHNSEFRHYNVLGLIDWELRKKGGLKRLWAFPVFATQTGTKGYFAMPMLGFYAGWDRWTRPAYETHKRTAFFMGFYHHSKRYINKKGEHWQTYESRQNFLWLYDRKYQDVLNADNQLKVKLRSYSMLFGAFHYKKTDEYSRMWALYNVLYGHGYKNRNNYYFHVLNYAQVRKQDYFHSSFLPLYWYHSRGGDGYRFIIPPLLSWFTLKEDGSHTNAILGGLLWYDNFHTGSGEGRKMLLLGSLYYEVLRSERNGYRGRGSLWGGLWEYQTESKTDYRKLSFLKIIYSKTHYQGKTKYRVLGIKF